MKPILRLKQGVLIALVLLVGLAVVAVATVVSINQQRNYVLEQSIAARKISRLSTRMLVLTHTASEYMTETNVRQWWVVHQSISDELDHLHFSDESGELSRQLDGRLGDLAALFSGFSHLQHSEQLNLDERRNSVLTDRLISEAEQLAELSYKISDTAFERQEALTHQRKMIVLVFTLLFGINSFLLLLLIRYRVVRPLEQIENAANAMRAGNLNSRCGLPEGDELGDVAAALDLLALELNNKLADVTSTTHLLEVAGRMCGVGAWTLNVSTHELTWSKQTYAIVEADFTHQPTLEEAIALYPEDSAIKLSRALEDAARTGADVNLELQLRTYKGNLIWVHVFGEVTWKLEGTLRKPWMIRGAFQNITERRRVEEEIRQAKELAESASKAKGEFLSNISHEIRTPLNAVVGLAYILKQSKLDSSQLEFVEKLENAGRGLIDLVSGVLDVSKIEAGAMELEKRPFSTRHLMDSLADLMTGAVADKSIEFVVSVAPNVPDHLVGDETKLRQVLVNLAGNAIKFTENGYVKVGVTLDQLDKQHCVLRFIIQDTGLGMDAGAMKRLFQSFSQADSSISRRFGGTGIGLALSQKLVELMGGTISAVSAPGQGSLFAFSLMLSLDSQASAKPEVCELAYDVMLVDSFKTQLDSVAHMVEWTGVVPRCFVHPELALNLPRDQQPRLFVVNGQLHDMNGLEFARTLKESHGPATKVVLMVRPKEVESLQPALSAGQLDAVLTKPVSFSALKNVLQVVSGTAAAASGTVNRPMNQNELVFLAGLTVLAVDDHKLNLMILKKILETHGAKVILAESGQAAIQVLSEPNHNDVDVCLMDVQMPEMDGMETCLYLRDQLGLRHLPVLALTAGVMESDHQQALAAGMDEVLVKPLQIDKVLDAVKRWGTQLRQRVPMP
ncbi:response regulator [Limnobacter sp.]|uniref:hybrid sensor histidine kinase/response regulator n=1 Tax=Limnobacter sp. TaxID=2003368 RepID=UPI0031200C86